MNPVLDQSKPRNGDPVAARQKRVNGSERASAFLDQLLAEQGQLTAVERFSRLHDEGRLSTGQKVYRKLLPGRQPGPGEQYAFEVNLDKCSGCKACVSACHSLNGLDEEETWRSVGLLVDAVGSAGQTSPYMQHITTACHHCVDPGCLNGCPVLAYEKDPVTGIVRHLDDQCMGCSYCVMKCPYEVPRYSSRLGIVRKCDMCTNRLAVGEAPACVQGCPNEAITIAVVKQRDIANTWARPADESAGSKVWLPDSPEPSITLPTTSFVTKRELPTIAFAADHNQLRLDHAHWPLVFMLVLTQTAAGLFVASALGQLAGLSLDSRSLSATGLAVLSAGLGASILHLGRPLKAWRAFLGWRRSWLSREVIALNAFAASVGAFVAIAWIPLWQTELSQALGVVLSAGAGLLGVFTSAMVYVDTRRPFWSSRYVFAQFFGTVLLMGMTLTTVLHAIRNGPQTQMVALGALVSSSVLFAWRRLVLRSASKNVASPIHFNARAISHLLPRMLRLGQTLFAVSAVFAILTMLSAPNDALVWASFAALAVFFSELNERYAFFAAASAKRMPGGVAS